MTADPPRPTGPGDLLDKGYLRGTIAYLADAITGTPDPRVAEYIAALVADGAPTGSRIAAVNYLTTRPEIPAAFDEYLETFPREIWAEFMDRIQPHEDARYIEDGDNWDGRGVLYHRDTNERIELPRPLVWVDARGWVTWDPALSSFMDRLNTRGDEARDLCRLLNHAVADALGRDCLDVILYDPPCPREAQGGST
jgi:hypothetical protein